MLRQKLLMLRAIKKALDLGYIGEGTYTALMYTILEN